MMHLQQLLLLLTVLSWDFTFGNPNEQKLFEINPAKKCHPECSFNSSAELLVNQADYIQRLNNKMDANQMHLVSTIRRRATVIHECCLPFNITSFMRLIIFLIRVLLQMNFLLHHRRATALLTISAIMSCRAGDIVETGVYTGGSSAIIMRVLLDLDTCNRRFWAFDSFLGQCA